MESNLEEIVEKYKGIEFIDRPPHWGGYRIEFGRVEFWQGRPSRLHDRIVYTKDEDGLWQKGLLQP